MPTNTIPTLTWELDEDGGWHASTSGTRSFEFFVEPINGNHWAFCWRGDDLMPPPFADFDDYVFVEADDAKDAALKHHNWYGDMGRFKEWYRQYRKNNAQ